MTIRGADNDAPGTSSVDFSALYDVHPEYVARREAGSLEQAQIEIEIRHFKLPNLMMLLPDSHRFQSVLEVGCATGELLAAVPVMAGGRKVGVDISPVNVEVARTRYPHIEFQCADIDSFESGKFDAVILSDVLEHVPHDHQFLSAAANLGEIVLVNLPLEDNWLNWWRPYGVNDVSGHLRKYALADGLRLFELAKLEVLAQSRVWFHETVAEGARRTLRQQRLGNAFSGPWPVRAAKGAIVWASAKFPRLGRRMFSSNLFVMARKRAPL